MAPAAKLAVPGEGGVPAAQPVAAITGANRGVEMTTAASAFSPRTSRLLPLG